MTDRWYWRARLGKDMPYVPLATWFGPPYVDGEELDRSPRWQCLLRNETTARVVLMGDETPIDVDDSRPDSDPFHSLSLRNLERIDKAEYDYMRDHASWASQHAPHHPAASPRTKISKRGPSVW